jgi:hypothetical protein
LTSDGTEVLEELERRVDCLDPYALAQQVERPLIGGLDRDADTAQAGLLEQLDRIRPHVVQPAADRVPDLQATVQDLTGDRTRPLLPGAARADEVVVLKDELANLERLRESLQLVDHDPRAAASPGLPGRGA